MPLTGNEQHSINRDKAVEFVKRYRDNKSIPNVNGVFFGQTDLLKALSQPGCIGLRIYCANNEKNDSTFVIVGVDGSEKDMTGSNSIMLELGVPCPPVCDLTSPLNM